MTAELTAFGAVDIPGTRAIRHYIIVCEHGTTQLDLEDRGPADDLSVLHQLLRDHRVGISKDPQQDEPCECEPTDRQRVTLRARLHA